MWAPGYFPFLFLILELIPQPGISQGANNWKLCQDCKKILKEADVTERFFQILVERAEYTPCPHNIVRFQLPRGIYCGNRIESWVDNVTGIINQREPPSPKSSENKQDHSKGSNEKPLLTTQGTTTSPGQSIKAWEGGTQKSSEATNKNLGTTQETLETTLGPTTAAPDSDQNKDHLLDNKATDKKEEEKSNTKHMTIAIISLIVIVLVMTSIATYFVCRKTKINKCKTTHNIDINMGYRQTLVEEPEEQEPGGDV